MRLTKYTYAELIVVVSQCVVEAVVPGDDGFRNTGRPAKELNSVVFKFQPGGGPHVHSGGLSS